MLHIKTSIITLLLAILPSQLIAGSVNSAVVPIILDLLSDSTSIPAPQQNQAPVARAGSDVTVQENRIVVLDGSNSSDDKGIVSYIWRDEFDLIGRDKTYTHIYALGSHALTLTVTDTEGLAHTDNVVVKVTQTYGANAGSDRTVQLGEVVLLNGTYRDSGGNSPRLQQWKKGHQELGRQTSLSYTANQLGKHTLTYLVRPYGGGADSTDTVDINVVITQNQAPVVDAGENRVVNISSSITITGSATDVNDNIQSYEWLEDDSVIANSKSFSYSPQSIGQHILTLRVTDSDNAVSQDKITVEVIADGIPIPSFATASHFTQNKIDISPGSIETLQAIITKRATIPHERKDFFKGDNARIVSSGSTLILENNSFNKYESLLAKYTQNGETIFVKLVFSKTVESFTKYTINSLLNGDRLEIVHTANMFNGNFEFNAKVGCEPVVAAGGGLRKDTLCMPTPTEQEYYITGLSNVHRLYNSIDTMNVYNAWGLKQSYQTESDDGVMRTLDLRNYAKDCLNFKECRDAGNLENFIYKNLFISAVPNQQTKLKTIHDPSAQGWGTGYRPSIFGGSYGEGFGTLSINRYSYNKNMYMIMFHEIMHGFGFSHQSSMTYGFSDALSIAIDKFYDYDTQPLTKVPKYVFQTEAIYDNKMLVSVYSTQNDTASKEFNVEFISAQNKRAKVIPRGNNKFVIEFKNKLATRLFLRVFTDDSSEVMSKLVYPADMMVPEELFTHNGEKFSMISNQEWRFVRGHAVLPIGMSTTTTAKMCQGWFGGDATLASGSQMELLNTTYTNEVSDLDSSIFIGRQYESDHRYAFKKYDYLDDVWSEVTSSINIVDNNGHILCKPSHN